MSKARELSNLPNYQVDTIAELRLTVAKASNDKASVLGYYSASDNIDVREYYWDSLSVEADNGGTIIAVTGVVTGRWKMKYIYGNINVEDFGATITSETNYASIQSAINFAASTVLNTGANQQVVNFGIVNGSSNQYRYYRVEAPLVVPNNVTLRGSKTYGSGIVFKGYVSASGATALTFTQMNTTALEDINIMTNDPYETAVAITSDNHCSIIRSFIGLDIIGNSTVSYSIKYVSGSNLFMDSVYTTGNTLASIYIPTTGGGANIIQTNCIADYGKSYLLNDSTDGHVLFNSFGLIAEGAVAYGPQEGVVVNRSDTKVVHTKLYGAMIRGAPTLAAVYSYKNTYSATLEVSNSNVGSIPYFFKMKEVADEIYNAKVVVGSESNFNSGMQVKTLDIVNSHGNIGFLSLRNSALTSQFRLANNGTYTYIKNQELATYPISMQVATNAISLLATDASISEDNTVLVSTGRHLKVKDGTWNGGLLKIGTYSLWVSAGGILYMKNGTPASDTDGTIVGSQV